MILIADSEDNLQNLLHTFNKETKKLIMAINAEKRKCMVKAKCLRDIAWKNKLLTTERRTKIYKTRVRPVLT